MKMTLRSLSFMLAALPVAAELPQPALTQPAPSSPSNEPVQPVEAEAPAPQASAPEPQLSEAEQRIRTGIIMLGRLHEVLARIKDKDGAEAAVAPVMRASAEFLAWAQGFSSLPPLDADTQRRYEKFYLPVIDELNTRIRIQGERLVSAEFYGSQNLPAALVRLVTAMQQ